MLCCDVLQPQHCQPGTLQALQNYEWYGALCDPSHARSNAARADLSSMWPLVPRLYMYIYYTCICVYPLICVCLTMFFKLLVSSFCSGLMELKGVDMSCWGNSSGQGVCQ